MSGSPCSQPLTFRSPWRTCSHLPPLLGITVFARLQRPVWGKPLHVIYQPRVGVSDTLITRVKTQHRQQLFSSERGRGLQPVSGRGCSREIAHVRPLLASITSHFMFPKPWPSQKPLGNSTTVQCVCAVPYVSVSLEHQGLGIVLKERSRVGVPVITSVPCPTALFRNVTSLYSLIIFLKRD